MCGSMQHVLALSETVVSIEPMPAGDSIDHGIAIHRACRAVVGTILRQPVRPDIPPCVTPRGKWHGSWCPSGVDHTLRRSTPHRADSNISQPSHKRFRRPQFGGGCFMIVVRSGCGDLSHPARFVLRGGFRIGPLQLPGLKSTFVKISDHSSGPPSS